MGDLGLDLAEDEDKEDMEELAALIMLRLVDQSIPRSLNIRSLNIRSENNRLGV